MADYDFFVTDIEAFCARLDALRALRGHGSRRRLAGRWPAPAGRREVVRDLLVAHYDPIYLESMRRNFAGVGTPFATLRWDGSEASLREAAATAIDA